MSKWKKPPPVVILSGAAESLRIRELKEAVSMADEMGRTIEYFQGTDRDELENTLSSSGVFVSSEMLLIVEKPEKVDVDVVMNHHNDADEGVTVILHQEGAIPPKSNLQKIAKQLPTRFVARFELPKPWEMEDHAVDFCVSEAKSRGIVLESSLAHAMVQNIGTDLGVLAFEVHKLALLLSTGESKEVKGAHVSATVGAFTELGPKPIVEALERRDLSATSRALANMRRTHAGNVAGAAARACAFLTRAATTWLHVAALANQGLDPDQISQRANVKSFRLRKNLLPVARRWGEEKLVALLKSLARVERSVRSGHVSPWVELECALFRALEDRKAVVG
jgi:DNA polymerase III delta subunit